MIRQRSCRRLPRDSTVLLPQRGAKHTECRGRTDDFGNAEPQPKSTTETAETAESTDDNRSGSLGGFGGFSGYLLVKNLVQKYERGDMLIEFVVTP
ncbi:MAG: hypothetical protein RDV41_11970 [Planctomycetota bacterium]|nr:hypothetical protein [Planctomycetota bacterium]